MKKLGTFAGFYVICFILIYVFYSRWKCSASMGQGS